MVGQLKNTIKCNICKHEATFGQQRQFYIHPNYSYSTCASICWFQTCVFPFNRCSFSEGKRIDLGHGLVLFVNSKTLLLTHWNILCGVIYGCDKTTITVYITSAFPFISQQSSIMCKLIFLTFVRLWLFIFTVPHYMAAEQKRALVLTELVFFILTYTDGW